MYVDTSTATDPASGPGIVEIVAGDGVEVDNSNPSRPTVSAPGGGGGVVAVVAGDNVSVDSTDPTRPVVAAVGVLASIVAGPSLIVDATDPANPVIMFGDGRNAGFSYLDAHSVEMLNIDGGQFLLDHAVASISASGGVTIAAPHLATPTGTFAIGADDTDLVINGSSHYYKVAGVGVLIIGTGGISVQGGAVFNPGHLATVALPDPADHPGGVVWDTTTLSLAVSDGTSWKHITAV